MLYYKKYTYSWRNLLKHGNYWTCSSHQKKGCKAYVVTNENETPFHVTRYHDLHNHPPRKVQIPAGRYEQVIIYVEVGKTYDFMLQSYLVNNTGDRSDHKMNKIKYLLNNKKSTLTFLMSHNRFLCVIGNLVSYQVPTQIDYLPQHLDQNKYLQTTNYLTCSRSQTFCSITKYCTPIYVPS